MNAVRQIFVTSFMPLRQRNLAIYLSGQAISLVGTWLQVTAQGWLVWQLSGSAAALGLVAALATLPLLVFVPFTGPIADRYDRRKLLIATQVVAMLLAFMLAFLVQTHLVRLWHVYLLALTLGIVTALDFPSQQAFIGDLSGMEWVRQAVNLNAIILQVSRILGPAIAGIVITTLGIAPSFWLNGLSFIPVMASLFAVRAHQSRRPNPGSPLHDLLDSLRFVRSQPRLLDTLGLVMLSAFFGLGIINIMPAFASVVLQGGARELGWLLAASGGGALMSVLIVVPLLNTVRRAGMVLALTAIWMGGWFLITSQATISATAILTVFLASMGGPAVATVAMGLIQLMSPADMRGRIVGLFIIVGFGIQPIASLWIGYLAQWFGVSFAIMVNAFCLCAGVVIILLTRREFRKWNTPS
jgi:Na+/melibiose symporter-like transporter